MQSVQDLFLIERAANNRLERTRRERASLLSCVSEPLKRRRSASGKLEQERDQQTSDQQTIC